METPLWIPVSLRAPETSGRTSPLPPGAFGLIREDDGIAE
jgi:hypothetical protein